MKKKLLFASTVFMALSTTYAQEGVGIGKSILPDATAVLDVGATDKGILIPRVTLTGEGDNSTIKGGTYPESLLVYHLGGDKNPLTKGFYFWLDGKWNALVSKTSTTTSEVLTKLTVKEDATTKEIVLSYIDEHNTNNTVEVSTALQNNDAFKKFISDLVTSTAGGTIVKAGTGITVKPESNNDPVNPVMTYTISADPVGITLAGDVTGKGTETVVERINGVNVAKPSDADFGLALVYDETTKTWKPGKPKIDNTSVTDKADLTVDSSLEFTTGTGTGALLSATGLKVKAAGITNTHLAVDAVKEGNIENSAVTETKIKDAAVTTGKIKGETKGQVLVSGDNNATAWVDQTTIVPKVENVTVDGSLEMTGGTGAVLATTDLKVKAGGINDTHLAVDAVTETKIKDAAVTTGKIKGGTKGQVLVSGDNNATVWVDQTTIVPKVENVTVDGSLEITGGTGAVLATTDLKVKAGGINDTHLAANAVTETKIKDAAVTTGKIKGGTKGQVLVSGDNNATVWVDQTTIVPKVENVTVDGSLEITGGTGAVLATTDLKVKAGGIADTHLAANAVTEAKIAANAVTETKILDAAVTTGKIKGGTKGQVLVSGDNNATAWVDQTTIVPKVENVTVDGSLEMTGGTGAVLATTDLKVKAGGINDTHLAANAVTETKIAANAVTETKILDSAVTTLKIKDEAVTLGKLAKGTEADLVLTTGAGGVPTWTKKDQIATKKELSTDGVILIGGGTDGGTKLANAVLETTALSIKAGGIADTHLAVGAVTETKILDSAVTTLKIKDEAVTLGKLAKGAEADLVLTTGAGGVPTWTKKDLIATKKDLTTDGVIVIGDAASTVTSLVGAVMQPTTLSLKNNSVVVDKLAIISGKNQHIVTDETGKPKWESKAVNVTSTATLLNEAIDGKKVYSITIPTAAVVAPTTNTGLTYNSEMTVPIAADFDYLLSVHIFDKNKKLVMSSVTDGTATGGKLTFRFGGNGMYLTLPVAADYRVVLKYASNVSYVN